MERRTFIFEQQRAQLDFILQGNDFLIWYGTIIIIKVHQKLSDLFQGTHSQTFNKVKKSLRPSPLLKLEPCFSRQIDVVPPQPVAAKVTFLYVVKVGTVFSARWPHVPYYLIVDLVLVLFWIQYSSNSSWKYWLFDHGKTHKKEKKEKKGKHKHKSRHER